MGHFDWQKDFWPAKLMLFGEYAVLSGGTALGIPILEFHLRMRKIPRAESTWQETIDHVWRIASFGKQDKAPCGFAVESNIPQGYGLGSSAALCLALLSFVRQSKDTLPDEEKFVLLRNMESVFHGSSSGSDPMFCAATGPLLIQMRSQDAPRFFTAQIRHPIGLALLDVGPRTQSNKDFVTQTLSRLQVKQPGSESFWDRYQALTRLAVGATLSGDTDLLRDMLSDIRDIQTAVGMLHAQVAQRVKNWPGVIGYKAIGAGGGGAVLVFIGANYLSEIPQPCLWKGVLGDV